MVAHRGGRQVNSSPNFFKKFSYNIVGRSCPRRKTTFLLEGIHVGEAPSGFNWSTRLRWDNWAQVAQVDQYCVEVTPLVHRIGFRIRVWDTGVPERGRWMCTVLPLLEIG